MLGEPYIHRTVNILFVLFTYFIHLDNLLLIPADKRNNDKLRVERYLFGVVFPV